MIVTRSLTASLRALFAGPALAAALTFGSATSAAPNALKSDCDAGAGPVDAPVSAALAQSVEHIIRNDGVTGSNPVSGTTTLFPQAIAPLHNRGLVGHACWTEKPMRGKWTTTCPASGSSRRTATWCADEPTSTPRTGSRP